MAASDITTWTVVAGVATVTVAALQLILIQYRRWRLTSEQNFNLEKERLRIERDRLEFEFRRRTSKNEPDRMLVDLIGRQNELLSKLDGLNVVVNVAETGHGASSPRGDHPQADYTSLIREISHSLNTPLSQIETMAILLNEDGIAAPEATESPAARILSSVEMCKAFLSGYRQLTQVADSAARWNPKSLKESITAAGEIYATLAANEISLETDIGEELGGYPNSFTLSALLPLLENAYESAPPNSIVQVRQSSVAEGFRLDVINQSDSHALSSDIYEPGVSHKDGHQGLGLPVVKRLLSAYEGANLSHNVSNEQARFTIFLPNQKDDLGNV
ncbi:hypothetical protein [Streptomyces sp. NPDC050164]|uniref:hypothetical protein n=1 Tax=Streptomyces sp. NPDC050164 TaxID=3365605 RepID=UPI0037930D0E